MEEKAKKLRDEIERLCAEFHYHKKNHVLERARELAGQIQDYCNFFLQGNIFEIKEEEYQELQSYVIQVLKDYMEALEYQDDVMMLDTLDIGLRELLMLLIEEEYTGEQIYAQ